MDANDVNFDNFLQELVDSDKNTAQRKFVSSYEGLCGTLQKQQNFEKRSQKIIYSIVLPIIVVFLITNVWLFSQTKDNAQSVAQETFTEENADFFAELSNFD